MIYNNPKFLKPFESLVTTYGSPDYNEIDPSGIIGLAFLLMFGVMFGDVGHGLVLFLVGRFLQKRLKSAEVLGKIMTRAGGSSMIFGLIFGSLFGHEFHGRYLPGLPLPFVPMENIDTFMAVAVAFGILFISIGLVINIINSIRSRDIEKGFLENHGLAGALFYWGAVAFLVKYIVSGTLGIPICGHAFDSRDPAAGHISEGADKPSDKEETAHCRGTDYLYHQFVDRGHGDVYRVPL